MRAMRRLTVAGVITALVAAFVVPARAAESGSIVGVIQNETTGTVQPRVRVTLLHLLQGQQEPEATTVTTDKNGRYEFDNLPTGANHIYALDVRHQGGLFASGTIVMPDDTQEEPVVDTELKVWDTTDDPTAILLRRNDIFLVPDDNAVSVVDSYRVVNTSDLAYIGRGGAGARTSLSFPLPESARGSSVLIVNEPRIDIPDLVPSEFGFGITAAIPPGRTDLTFSYSVEGTGGSYDLTRTALYPILDSSVFAQSPLEIRSNRLVERGTADIGGEDYLEYSAPDAVDAGDPLQILAVAEAGVSTWLVVGAAIMFGLIALLLAVGLVVRRRNASKRAPQAQARAAPSRDREAIVVAIAELDLRYRNGDIGEEEWRARREELKARVDERAPEHTS